VTQPIGPPQWPHSPEFGPIATFQEGTYAGQLWLTHVTSAVDWLGKRFSVGEKVLYCIGAGGRRQRMAIGTVKAMRARQTYDYNLEGAMKAPLPADWEVEVLVLTEQTSGVGNNKRTKPAWVNPRNVTALPVEVPLS
jgi:hypothetical protein